MSNAAAHNLLARRCVIALALLIGLTSRAQACASCGCTLTADWLSQRLAAQPGTTLSLRYDYVPQTSLQSGTDRIDRSRRNVTPQLQLSFRATGRDSGPGSDRPNSGGEQVNLSPGLSAKISSRLVGFGFVELPLYNRVSGYQLVPRAKLSLGLLIHLM